jgi:DNA polymerase-1
MRLLVVDGSGLVYRAHYAMVNKPLTNREGQSVNVIYQAPRMISGLIERWLPSEVVVVFDPRGQTRKHTLVAEYKAQRKPAGPDVIAMLEDLARQKNVLREFLDAMGVWHLTLDGWEADEVIVSIAAQSLTDETLVVSDDKDMYQCINERTSVVKIPVDSQPFTLQSFWNKYNINPAQWPHVQALMGDSSDGYPGVKGIGEKNALRLIRKYNTWSEAVAKAAEESPSICKKLTTGAEDAFKSYLLAWCSTNVLVPQVRWPLGTEDVEQLAWLKAKYLTRGGP